MASRLKRLVRLLRPSRGDRIVGEEIGFHLEMETRDLMSQGWPPDDARRAARLRVGSVEAIREEARDVRTIAWVRDAARDARYAVRGLVRAPGFALVAVLTLAMGTAFAVTLFAITDAILLRPLPVSEPDRLVDLYTSGGDGGPHSSSSAPDLADYAERTAAFTGVAGYAPMVAAVAANDRADLTLGEIVTGGYFELLGVSAALGRALQPQDDRPGSPPVAVISAAMWHQAFGGRADVIGRTLSIRGHAFTVVGVLPDTFTGMLPMLAPKVWVPVQQVAYVEPMGISENVPSPTGTSRVDRRGQRWLFAKARLAPGISIEQARAGVEAAAAGLRAEHPQTNRDRRPTIRPTTATRIHPDADPAVSMAVSGAMAGVALLLVVTAANVAGMVLARGASRTREVALRLAMGAGRGRVARQLLAENLVLTLSATVVGVSLAWWLTGTVNTVRLPLPVPLSLDLRIDVRVLVFAAAATGLTSLLVGLVPAFTASRTAIGALLKSGAGDRPSSFWHWSARDVLIVAQVAVTTVFLLVAGVLVQSILSATSANVGFSTGGLAIVSADPALAGYSHAEAQRFWADVEAAIRRRPGVREVAFGSRFPFSLNFSNTNIAVPGHQRDADEMGRAIVSATVSPGYFDALGIAIVQGRAFTSADTPDRQPVAIVNETMARQYWPGESAVGRRVFQRMLSSGRSFDVVGVVANHRLRTIGEADQPAIYFSSTNEQSPGTFRAVIVRADGDDDVLVRDLAQLLISVDPRVPIFELETMTGQISATLLPVRIGARLGAIFGGLAVLLSAMGLYGVVVFTVARRTPEIGLRLALGARRRAVLGLLARRGLALATTGLVFGLCAGVAATSALAGTGALYRTSPIDPIAWIAAGAVVAVVTAVATIVPALRAIHVDPIRALRVE